MIVVRAANKCGVISNGLHGFTDIYCLVGMPNVWPQWAHIGLPVIDVRSTAVHTYVDLRLRYIH